MAAPALAAEPAATTATTSAVATTPTSASTSGKTVISLVAVGDDLIHDPIYQSAKKSNGKYDFSNVFKHVKKDVQAADIAVINQETIFTNGSYSGYPCFGSPKALGKAIRDAGFDVVQCATNHTMDRGESAIRTTLQYWKRYPEIKVLGIHSSKKAAKKVAVVERQGVRVAFLNYTYGLNGIPTPYGKGYLVDRLNWGNRSKIKSDIKRAKKAADMVVVCVHEGIEYEYTPSFDQKRWAKWFANQGVSLYLGTHPHVVQPVRWVKSSSGKHKMLTYYSLGNFVSSQNEVPRVLGAMASVKIVKDAKGARVKSYDMIPLVTHYNAAHSYYTTYKLSDYTSKLARKHYLNVSVSGLKRLYKSITGRSA